jgi:Mg-chelatase subunit ChlI
MKIEVFREMYELNEAFERIIESLRRLEKFPFLCRGLVQGTRAEAVVLQVEANEFFFDKFERIAGDDARWAYKFLNDTRERLKDPEDVYLEVKHREEARKKKGLPPRVTFLADWDSGDEQRYDEEQAEKRKKRAARKQRKTAPKRNAKANKASRVPATVVSDVTVAPATENES